MLLGAQPGSCTAGELKATSLGDSDSYRCSCHERIRTCPFWKEVTTAMASCGYPDFDITQAGTNMFQVEGNFIRRLLAPIYHGGILETVRDKALSLSSQWRTHAKDCNARNYALVDSLQEVTRARVVVDPSKNALRLKYLLQAGTIDLRVIRVIRDDRAVSLTYMDGWNFADSSNPEMRGGGTGVEVSPIRRSMAVAANGGNAAMSRAMP